jgi:hypothetical protein
MNAFLQRLQRFTYADVEIDADSPSEATIGAMQAAIAGGVPEDLWMVAPITASTVKPVGGPRLLPHRPRLEGQDAFTTEPPRPPLNLDDLPDGAEVPEEALEGLVDHDGEIVEDVDASSALDSGDVPDLSGEILEYLMMEEAVDQKRQQGMAISDEELAALRDTRHVLLEALTPVEDDGDITEAPANDPTPAG